MSAGEELVLTQTTISRYNEMLGSLELVGSTVDLAASLQPLFDDTGEIFLPSSIYVRKEMCQVFKELTKEDRDAVQILIGSPGVGKSILLFLVALYRAVNENKPCCFIRKVRNPRELASVFVFHFVTDTSAAAGTLTVSHNRSIDPVESTQSILKQTLNRLFNTPTIQALTEVNQNRVLLFLDGLHEGDVDLRCPHHYLSTSGGYDAPYGESAAFVSLVVLGGWQKEDLVKGLKIASSEAGIRLTGTNEMETEDELMDDIFYHTGGRIRDALLYLNNPVRWRAKMKAMIDFIPKENAVLSIVSSKGSIDPKRSDRIRTMFRKENGIYFGSTVQIVDSQYYARLLQDRVGLEDYFNAYKHAMQGGLFSAAGCHFEELLHHLFQKRPTPITQVLRSVGKGAEGVKQLLDYSVYWIPSIPNFSNIDAAVVIKDGQGSVTIWCLQYTVSSTHVFNSTTFRAKFLRQVITNFNADAASVKVKILFVVPHDVYSEFQLPEEVEVAGFAGAATFVDCRDVDALEGCFERFDFIEKPLSYFVPVGEMGRSSSTSDPADKRKRIS